MPVIRDQPSSDVEFVVRRNIVANVVGKSWSAVATVLLVPIYLRVLGVESFGIITAFSTAQVILAGLDFGLSTAANRRLAYLQAKSDGSVEARSTMRTLEVFYWGAALAIVAVSGPFSSWLASDWLRPEILSIASVKNALNAMGIALALQVPYVLYAGGLMGLQRQVLLNKLLIITITFRGVGALVVLFGVAPTIQAFMSWQIVANLLQTTMAMIMLWRSLPAAGERATFNRRAVRDLMTFAYGVFGVAVSALALSQVDKVVLSRLLTLEAYGYYGLAAMVAAAPIIMVQPVFSAIFPRLSFLVATRDLPSLRRTYRWATQVSAVILFPASILVMLFSREILLLWTHDPLTATNALQVASILAAGFAFSGILYLPYALQLAHGWTRLTFTGNWISLALLVPSLIVLVPRYGPISAAAAWSLVNAVYAIGIVAVMHRRLLVGGLRAWWVGDIGLPAVAALVVIASVRGLTFEAQTDLGRLISLTSAGGLGVIAAGLAASDVRRWATARLRALL